MRILVRYFGRLLWLCVFAVVLYMVWQHGLLRMPMAMLDPSSEAAFQQWLDDDSNRRGDYAEFSAFLETEGVSDIVPAWQLARVDRFYADRCDLPVWRLPPRNLWGNIVPALRLVRDEVEPAVGQVSVYSSYRTPELNVCAGGAARSRHLNFQALDLRLETPRADLSSLYRDLCQMHEESGPQSGMGMGAYYDFNDNGFNRGGRFHIDAAGYRTWGRSYTTASSPCGRFD